MENIQYTDRKTGPRRALAAHRLTRMDKITREGEESRAAEWEPLHPVAAEYMGVFTTRVRYKIDEAKALLDQLRSTAIPRQADLIVDGLVFALTRQVTLEEGFPAERVEEFLRILAPHLHYRYDPRLVGRGVLWSTMNEVNEILSRHQRPGGDWKIRDSIRLVLGAKVLELEPGDRVLEDLCDVVLAELASARQFLRSEAARFLQAPQEPKGGIIPTAPGYS